MTDSPPRPGGDPADEGLSPLMRASAVLLLVLPILGILLHVAVLAGGREWVVAYYRSRALGAVAVVAFGNLFATYFHYRRTRMRVDVVSRILSNAWIFSLLMVLYVGLKGYG